MKQHRLPIEPMVTLCLDSPGDTIFAAAAKHYISIRSDCGGEGRCGKCLVFAQPVDQLAKLSAVETKMLTSDQILSGQRLACQAKIKGKLTVTISSEHLEGREVFGKTDIQEVYSVDPSVERLITDFPDFSSLSDNLKRDLTSWIEEEVLALTGKSVRFLEPNSLRDLSRRLTSNGPITLVCHEQKGVIAVLDGHRKKSLGVAVDLGTTTVAVYLCDLQKGSVLTTAAAANPQKRYGRNVMSRIAFAKTEESGTAQLNQLLVAAVNGLIGICLKVVGAERQDIDELSVVGNTTMQQIFAGLHPNNLGRAPYLPVSCVFEDMRAVDLGLDLNSGTNVHFLPAISGFIGGDTVGAIMSVRPYEKDEITLIIDIGTNGELVLGNRQGLWAGSCATGPAFEGSHISCGVCACDGAISKVDIDPVSQELTYDVLGKFASILPKGICGSGIIDTAAAMLRAGILLPNGRLMESMPGVLADERGIGREFLLISPENSPTKCKVSLTLKDIRQIQLAKAALSAGITLLMRQSGISSVDRVVLTGAFGARFDWRNAVTIGMLPRAVVTGQVSVVENAAGVGAVMALLDRKKREVAREVAKKVLTVDLSQHPDFDEEFPKAMSFPQPEKT